MKIAIDISLTSDRIKARRDDGTVVFDDVALVAVKPDAKGKSYLVGIGSDRLDREGTTVLPVVSQIQFQPAIAAAVTEFLVHKSWADLRPGWKAPLSLLDRVDVRITLEGYELLSPDDRRAFVRYLPQRQMTWWVNGEKVKV